MSNAFKFMLMMVLVSMLMETGNFGVVASTDEIARSIQSAQTDRMIEGVAVVPQENKGADMRSSNVSFSNESVSDSQSAVEIPNENADSWGNSGFAILNETMINAVSPAAYASVILLRKSEKEMAVIGDGDYEVVKGDHFDPETPWPTATEYPDEETPTPQNTLTPRSTWPTATEWPIVFVTATPSATNTNTATPTHPAIVRPTLTARPTKTLLPTPSPYPSATFYPTLTPVPSPVPQVIPYGS